MQAAVDDFAAPLHFTLLDKALFATAQHEVAAPIVAASGHDGVANSAHSAEPPTSSGQIFVDSNYTIAANQTLSYTSDFSSDPDFFVEADGGGQDGEGPAFTLTNYANLQASSVLDNDTIVTIGTFDYFSADQILNYGSITAAANNTSAAVGILSNSDNTLGITNELGATISATAHIAFGMNITAVIPFLVVNNGTIEADGTVTSSNGVLVNVILAGAPIPITNTGMIEAIGAAPIAVSGATILTNSGTIEAHSTVGTTNSYGVTYTITVINSGEITATSDGGQAYGIAFTSNVINHGDISAITALWDVSNIQNFGTIEGTINLQQGAEGSANYTLINDGTITGDVYLGTDSTSTTWPIESSFYDGRGGSLTGTVYGGDGNDAIYGDKGNNTLDGGAGNDLLMGGPGNDTLNGGAGTDTAAYFDATGPVIVNLTITGPQNVGGGDGTDTLISIENLIGSSFNDTLTGDSAGNSVLEGGPGNDILNGNGSDATASYQDATSGVTVSLQISGAQNVGGGDGIDTLNSIANITGSPYNDTLIGNSGNNVLTGGGGIDTMIGGGGNDTFDGSGGFATVLFNTATSAITVNLGETGSQAIGGGEGTDTLINMSGVVGSQYNDTLTGNSGSTTLEGGPGNDTLNGGGGNATASYADATGPVTVNLTISGPQNVGGGDGFDTLIDISNLIGSSYNDTLTGNSGNNVLEGGPGDDTLIGNGGMDLASYADATSGVTVNMNLTTQNVGGGDGTDTFVGISGVIGSNYNDTLIGNGNGDYLYGGGGDDTFVFTHGADTFYGGAGSNTVDCSGAARGIWADLPNQTYAGEWIIAVPGGPGLVYGSQIDNVIGTPFNDLFDSNGSNNTFIGGGGNDQFILTGGGTDTAIGGTGNDSFSVGSSFNANFVINGGGGNDVLYLDPNAGTTFSLTFAATTIVNIQTLALGADSYNLTMNNANVPAGQTMTVDGSALTSSDSLTLNAKAATDGNYAILGGAGNDTLTGGAGNDVLEGGAGVNVLNGGGGQNTASYADATSGVTVSVAIHGAQNVGGGLGTDTLISIQNLTGSAYNDTLTGNSGNNVLSGGAGNDILNISAGGNDIALGGDGNDTIIAGGALMAADQIDGGTGVNKVVLNGDYSTGLIFAATTMINVQNLQLTAGHSYNLTTNDATVAKGQTLTVNGATLGAHDVLIFNGSAETDGKIHLEGGAGSDTLIGGAGNDTISGGAGADNLTGGGGRDTFVYNSVSDSTGSQFDTIHGFDFKLDHIQLTFAVAGIDAAVKTGALSTATFDTDLATDLSTAQLGAHFAVLFTASAGTLAGQTFLVIDANGVAGYQAGQDIVINLAGALNATHFAVADFTT
jgi:Ca2+-binding RTX toxin-like protein